jgi:hypothetical protein
MNIVESRDIELPTGATLNVAMTQEFIDRARLHFGLSSEEKLDDDHVRMYVWGAVNTAVDRAESEMTSDGKDW